jgi:hypothetical protein
MRAFADQIAAGLRGRGYRVQEITAPVLLGRIYPLHTLSPSGLGIVINF